MIVDYISYSHTDNHIAIAEWAERLLPSTWVDAIPSNSEERISFLLGRMLLCRRLNLLGYSYFDLPRMYYTPNGKAYFGEQLYFDITYTSDIVVLAFSERQEMGIDATQVKPLSWQSFESDYMPKKWITFSQPRYPSKTLISDKVLHKALSKLIDETLNTSKIKVKKSYIKYNKVAYHHQTVELSAPYITQIITAQPSKALQINNVTHQLASGLRIVRVG